ncbi:dipeptide/oligopeptide/nickel ABC transporter permease/ATP-binding protein [Pseudonocardia nematodicida]|uniref:Dipeptide/oligopeptide/nickel ABC transporter permease/ATP-binding protein n=1 Tax=Pseudonocardia nematodicida TaxID=1206997 RepID=A0ABV1KE02_9PSEU
MTLSSPPAEVPANGSLAASARRPLFRRVLHNPLGAVTLVFLALVVVAAVFAPLLAPHDPNAVDARNVLAPPGEAHPLGTDPSGQDVLSRLLFAARSSLLGALTTVVVASVLGVGAGLVAGYHGRRFEASASAVSDLLMALPTVVMLLAARSVIGPSSQATMAILGIMIAPAFYRVVSNAVVAVRHELYVDAARVSGLSDARIIGRHVLTVVRAPAIILAAGVGGIAIALQAGFDFLGLGDLSRPSWGGMLNTAFSVIFRSPQQLIWPGLAIGLTCVALILLGNALRDELERTGGPPARRRRSPARSRPVDEPVHSDDDRRESTADDSLLDVDRLSVGYDQPDGSVTVVVPEVSLTARRGEVHGLIGESGSGKTQTAFSVLRLLPPGGRILGGAIRLGGQDLARLSEREMTEIRGRRIAYIPQEPMSNLDPTFTIGHQLAEPLRITLGLGRAAAKEHALTLLARVGIPDPERTYSCYPHQISGGMAQRVLIAGAVSTDPDLLIADEPTTALDVTVQAEVLDLLRDLQSESRMGILLVTHNFGVVADLCDRVSVMREGRIVESGSTREVFAAPQHDYTRMLFGSILAGTEPRGPLAETGPDPATKGLPA